MIILYKVEIKDWGARDWGTPQIMSENVAWKGDNRQNLVFPTVFPRDFDTPRDLIYMLYLDWYDAKFSRKSGSFQKQCVFPLFSRQIKKELRFYLNSLIFNVDQLGLEPRTSRLWVCCSNQLSYKSGFGTLAIPNAAVTIRGCKINHFRGILQINWRENSVQWIFSVDWICCFISYSPDFANA